LDDQRDALKYGSFPIAGKLKFALRGHKLKGTWPLVRIRKKEETKQEPNEEQSKLLLLGLENPVGVLGNIISGLGEAKH
jgi:hypothetical protein